VAARPAGLAAAARAGALAGAAGRPDFGVPDFAAAGLAGRCAAFTGSLADASRLSVRSFARPFSGRDGAERAPRASDFVLRSFLPLVPWVT
jgi:hypothetical protein